MQQAWLFSTTQRGHYKLDFSRQKWRRRYKLDYSLQNRGRRQQHDAPLKNKEEPNKLDYLIKNRREMQQVWLHKKEETPEDTTGVTSLSIQLRR
jgi:hypothetical protein